MVYVDKSIYRLGRMIMCHMIADDLDELHAMAEKIGLRRAWFQDKPGHPHYDVSKSKRTLAIQHGAVEVEPREIVRILKERYAQADQRTND